MRHGAPTQPREPLAALVQGPWALAAILTAISFSFVFAAETDLWWHLEAGRWMRQHHALALSDAWSFTEPGRPWRNHEWLAQVLYDRWVASFGLPSLVYWKWGVLGATWLVLFRVAIRTAKDPLSAYLACLAAAALAGHYLDLRPHLYSLLGTALLLHAVVLRKPSRLLPALFLVWANLHGGFVFGLLALPLLLAPWAARQSLRPALRLYLLCVAAACVNPNTFWSLLEPLLLAFQHDQPFRLFVKEWRPPFGPGAVPDPLFPFALALFGLLLLGLVLRRPQKEDRAAVSSWLALCLLALFMSLTSRRFIPLFAIAQIPLLAFGMAPWLKPLRRLPPWIAPVLALGFGLLRLAPYPLGPQAFDILTGQELLPVETCNFIEANRLQGHMLTDYDWGGYVLFRTQGRVRMFIDSRAQVVYSAQTFWNYTKIRGLKPGWFSLLEASGTDLVLCRVQQHRLVAGLLASSRWRILYQDVVSVLLARRDQALPDQLQPSPETGYRAWKLGAEAAEAGQFQEAQIHLRRALELDPTLLGACETLARTQLIAGAIGEAWATENHCQSIFPLPERLSVFKDRAAKSKPPR